MTQSWNGRRPISDSDCNSRFLGRNARKDFTSVFTRFAEVADGQWDVLERSNSVNPVARVTLDKEGHCTYVVTSDRTLSAGELATLNIFVKAHERA